MSRRASRWVGVLALAIGAFATGARADEITAWTHALRAGGLQPADEAVAELAKAGEPAVRPLAELLATGTALERRRVCVALGSMSESVTAAIDPLATASADGDVEVRLAAVEGLARWTVTHAEARAALRARLADEDQNVRVRAASALAALDDAALTEPVLLAALGGAELGPRVAALGGLARRGERASAVAAAAVTGALGDPLAQVRAAAVVALAAARPRDPEAVASLCARLGDPDPWVAMGTARALAEVEAAVGDCGAAFLGSRDPATARRAAWLLHARAVREPAAAATLAAHVADADPVVRGYARSAAWLAGAREPGAVRGARERE